MSIFESLYRGLMEAIEFETEVAKRREEKRMSVLIKGMEMPKNCHECPLLYVTSLCDWSKGCPLQPIERCENCNEEMQEVANLDAFYGEALND